MRGNDENGPGVALVLPPDVWRCGVCVCVCVHFYYYSVLYEHFPYSYVTSVGRLEARGVAPPARGPPGGVTTRAAAPAERCARCGPPGGVTTRAAAPAERCTVHDLLPNPPQCT